MFENKEILLVEDNASSAELIRIALRQASLEHNVRIVHDGMEMLSYIHRQGEFADRQPSGPPVLVLLDLNLPRLSGLQILKMLRDDKRTCLIPVVIFTASVSEKDIVKSYDAGANGYVVKPIRYEKFAEVVKGLGTYWLGVNVPPSQ